MSADSRFAAVIEAAAASREACHVPGMAIGVLADGEELTEGLGVTDPRAPLGVDADTLFQIGSISKTFAAALTALLAQRGRLDLDAPLRDYLPEFQVADADATKRVTPRHLLSHNAGWLGDHFEMDNPSLELAVARMRWMPQLYPLGELWSYNNAAFYVAGRLLEVVGGKPYAMQITQEFLNPLGMSDTGYRLTDLLTAKVAMGFSAVYKPEDEAKPGRWYGVGAVDPVGGLSSTVNNLLRWARFMIDGKDNAGNEILNEASREALRELRTPGAVDTFSGLSWFTQDVEGVRLMHHGGSMIYQESLLLIAPERNVAFVALTNSERGSESIRPVKKAALSAFLDITEPELETVEGTAATLAQYAGEYQAALSAYNLTIEGNTLLLKARPEAGSLAQVKSPEPPPTRLALTERQDILKALDVPYTGTLAEFLGDDQGEIVWMRIGGRVHRKQ
jgi:CubicO group peptidase (beta-lactamase class C family)